MWRLKALFSLTILLLVATVGALAQGGNVAITGTVADQSGAVVNGA